MPCNDTAYFQIFNGNQFMKINLESIGIIKTPFESLEGMPIQPSGAKEIKGEVVLDPAVEDGLKDLDGFSHIILIYLFHQSDGYDLRVTPFLDHQKRGLFSTRAPRRPNPIGLSVVELLAVNQNRLSIKGIDVLNNTPLMDIKPYVPGFDINEPYTLDTIRTGWLSKAGDRAETTRSDQRFIVDSDNRG